jgi:hypothetical protein
MEIASPFYSTLQQMKRIVVTGLRGSNLEEDRISILDDVLFAFGAILVLTVQSEDLLLIKHMYRDMPGQMDS